MCIKQFDFQTTGYLIISTQELNFTGTMERIKSKFISATRVWPLVVFAMLVLAAACTRESETVSSIQLSQTSVRLSIGGTFELTAAIYPESARNNVVTWSSSAPDIVAVDNGTLTAVAIGSAVITAQAGNVTATCSVTVGPVEVTSIQLSEKAVTMSPGEIFELTASVQPENATDKTITWSSSDTGIVTVAEGKLTAVDAGTATVTAKAGNVKAECSVTVNPINVTSVELSQTSMELLPGESSELTATVYPEDATDKTVTWSSSDTDVAVVTDGMVTAISVGSAIITAQAGNFSAQCSVSVNPIKVTAIELSQTSMELLPGESSVLTATVYPENATDKTVTWSSSDTDIAIVADGMVTAVAVGSAIVTAQSGNVKAECTVTVNPIEVTSVELSRTSVELLPGESVELTAAVYPENATDKTVIWSSSNTEVATVVEGKITAVAAGSAVITAQAGNVKAECSVTVTVIDVTSIRISRTFATLSTGETLELTASVEPENATYKDIAWSSSDTGVATVTDGKVTAVAAGSVVITAAASNGLTASCRINVVKDPGAGGSEGTGEIEW